MNAYNPQHWSMNAIASNEAQARHSRMSFSQQLELADSVTGMETSMPSPPPPYLPSVTSGPMGVSTFRCSPTVPQAVHSQRPSPTIVRSGYSPPACISASRITSGLVSNTPSQQTSPTLFPPPPSNQRDRSGSRARGVINNISAWASRHKTPEPVSYEPNSTISKSVSSDSLARLPLNLPLTVDHPTIHTVPPATRRAVSVGYPISALTQSRETSRNRQISNPNTAWEPGMPLPPPPPGPPPGLRSQSLSRNGHASGISCNGSITPPHLVRSGNTLGSIPPTPVGWTEENDVGRDIPQAPGQNRAKQASEELARLLQRRDGSPKSIRERRNESRARSRHGQGITEPGGGRAASVSLDVTKPLDLVLSTDSNLLVRQRRMTKSPKEHSDSHIGGQNPDTDRHETNEFGGGKQRVDKVAHILPVASSVLTPPFSPESVRRNSEFNDHQASMSFVGEDGQRACATTSSTTRCDATTSTYWPRIDAQEHTFNNYSRNSLLRYKSFLRTEQDEPDDSKRLMLFAEFMVEEFRLRSAASPEMFAGNTESLRGTFERIWSMPKQHADISSENRDGRYGNGQMKAPMALNTTNLRDARYEPILSPILSTVMSKEASIDSDIRGRTSSRWWESSTSSGSIGCIDSLELERSKRESKYMGIARDSHFEPQSKTTIMPNIKTLRSHNQTSLTPNIQTAYSRDEFGLHRQQVSPEVDKSPELLSTPRPHKVDISRLISLPPSFPRRHPALSNSHPKLTSYRTVLQTLRNRSLFETRRDHAAAASQRATCDITFIHDQLLKRINEASINLNELCCDLTAAVTAHDPTLPQEEGDDEPELLEKLTIAKRIFEAREQLYKDQIALQIDSKVEGSKGNSGRHSTQTLSNLDTQFYYARLAAKRHKELQHTVQGIILGGIEDQLSTFWDIATPLVDVVRKVPSDLRNFYIEIPDMELVDNPTYDEFPLQYFYSLLVHAEKSTYQFIDSQINLFCLLHEIKSIVANSRCNLIETQWILEGRDSAVILRDLQAMENDADLCLTKELQGQVAVVEEQWKTALGNEFENCKARVKEHLQSTSGWVEGFEEYS